MYKYSTGTIDAVGSTLMNGPLPWLVGAAAFFLVLTFFLLRKASTFNNRGAGDITASQTGVSPTPEEEYEKDIRNLLLPAGDIRFDLYVSKDRTEREEVIAGTRQRLLAAMDGATAEKVAGSHPEARDFFLIQEEAFKSLVTKATPEDEEEPVALYWELERAFEDSLREISYKEAEADLPAVYAQVKERRAAEKELEEAEVTAFWNSLSATQQVSLDKAETRSLQKAAILRFGGDPSRLDVMARLGFVVEAPILAPYRPSGIGGHSVDGETA